VLRETLVHLVNAARAGGDEALEAWAPIYNHDLPALILRCLAAPAQRPRMVQPLFRARALERAVGLLASYDRMPENVETLSRVAGASWATLLRAFKDEFGVSPKRYMKIRRLTAVREALLERGDALRISDVANEWGFWHMGSFAADYREQFGELPSETRKRSRAVDAP
jgi:AraC-like DNA-binding protein